MSWTLVSKEKHDFITAIEQKFKPMSPAQKSSVANVAKWLQTAQDKAHALGILRTVSKDSGMKDIKRLHDTDKLNSFVVAPAAEKTPVA